MRDVRDRRAKRRTPRIVGRVRRRGVEIDQRPRGAGAVPIGNIPILWGKLGRERGGDHAARVHQRQILAVAVQLEIGVQPPPDQGIGAARCKYHQVLSRRNAVAGKGPFGEVPRIVSQVPALYVYISGPRGTRVANFNPVRIVGGRVGVLGLIDRHEFGDFQDIPKQARRNAERQQQRGSARQNGTGCFHYKEKYSKKKTDGKPPRHEAPFVLRFVPFVSSWFSESYAPTTSSNRRTATPAPSTTSAPR